MCVPVYYSDLTNCFVIISADLLAGEEALGSRETSSITNCQVKRR